MPRVNAKSQARRGIRTGESGAVLIIALFVLAVAAIIIVGFTSEHLLSVRRSDNQRLADQAWQYLRGAEDLGMRYLIEQLKGRGDGDELLSLAGQYQFETDHGWLAYEIIELQGSFNLNALYTEGAIEGSVPRTENQRRFIRLLLSFEELAIEQTEAVGITEALLDWLDEDVIETGFGGAEAAWYTSEGLAYQPANGPLRGVSELLLVRGMTPELYQQLQGHVTVWPAEGGAINIAGASSTVIGSLYAGSNLEPMDRADAEQLLVDIQEGKITNLQGFLARPEWGGTPLASDGLQGRGSIFRISSQTQVGRIMQGLDSIVRIDEAGAVVLARNIRML